MTMLLVGLVQYMIRYLKMYSGKEDFFYERVSLAFPIDSPWIKYFDIEIKKIVRAGLIKRWKQVSRSEVAPWHFLSYAGILATSG